MKKYKDDVEFSQIQKYFKYDKKTGILTWAHPRQNVKVGDVAGCDDGHGYLMVGFHYRNYNVARIALSLVRGEWIPSNMHVDHINGKRNDNRLKNLRLVSPHENNLNRRLHKKNKFGCNGIYRLKNGNYHCYIGYNNDTLSLGTYKTLEEAISVRKKAEERYGFHKNHGK